MVVETVQKSNARLAKIGIFLQVSHKALVLDTISDIYLNVCKNCVTFLGIQIERTI